MRDQLSIVDFYQGLAPEQLDRLAEIVSTRTVVRGEMIFQEGDESKGLYSVLEGSVRIFKTAPSGKEQVLHLFGPGNSFGEVAVFTNRRLPANAQAMKKSLLLFTPRERLKQLMGEEPELAMSMLGLLSFRLVHFVHKVEELALKEVPARLAAHLLLLRGSADATTHQPPVIRLDMPKGQLAAYLGTIPETFSRILKKMEIQGIIQVDGQQITLTDEDQLEEVATGLERL